MTLVVIIGSSRMFKNKARVCKILYDFKRETCIFANAVSGVMGSVSGSVATEASPISFIISDTT